MNSISKMLKYHLMIVAGGLKGKSAPDTWVLTLPVCCSSVAPGQMRGNRTVGRSCVQEVMRSEARSMYRTLFCFETS